MWRAKANMQLTQQIRINPTIAQDVILEALSEKCRLIYNFALKERKEAFEKGVKGVNYIKQQNDLPEIKEKYPEYKWVYSKVLQYTLRTLDANYKSFFALNKKGDKDARPPKFLGKRFFTTMVHNQSGFKIGKGYVELSHKHPTGTKLRFEIPKSVSSFAKVYQISIYKKEKEYFLSVTYEKPEPEYKDNGLYQAFDLGVIKHAAVNTSGKFKEFTIQRPDKYWAEPISELQSRQAHCKKNSNKYKKLGKIIVKCKRKSSNQSKDFQHKLSRKIIDNTKANTIIVGDLSVKSMCQINRHQHGLHQSLHNTGNIGRFVGFLTYKAKLAGKRVVETSERDTSKRCCQCGKKQPMPLHKRKYVCDCGNSIDRDNNSSVNIMLNFLSQNGLCTAYRRFVDNLRQTGLAVSFVPSASHPQEAPSLGTG